jgi:hypothetical protein
MNLPLVFDIAIGLIFIYLILSLLTSEIQELIATLLQWRAEHLKKAIDILLTGEVENNSIHQNFVDDLYNSPPLKALNQEAKGKVARSFRKISHAIGDFYRSITGMRNAFGNQRSGPSYIPSEAFATAVLQKLDLELLSQKVSELTVQKFNKDKLELVRQVLQDLRISLGDDSLLVNELQTLEGALADIFDNFVRGRITFTAAIDQTAEQLKQFVDNTESSLSDNHYCQEIIRRRLPYLQQAIALKRMEPTVSEVLAIILDKSNQKNLSPQIGKIVARINERNPEIPEQLRQNLISLARQAQFKANSLQTGVQQLEQEIATWFDHSMERSSGVYKRNSKGIAIAIGFLVAVISNADTFHIVNRLSKDSILRSTISNAADQLVAQPLQTPASLPSEPAESAPEEFDPPISEPTEEPQEFEPEVIEPLPPDTAENFQDSEPQTFEPLPSAPLPVEPEVGQAAANPDSVEAVRLRNIRDAVDDALQGLSLPIGWNQANTSAQAIESQYSLIPFFRVPYLRRIIGWFISGIALSMGASFWYDLLSKVMRVRNSGRRSDANPTSSDATLND